MAKDNSFCLFLTSSAERTGLLRLKVPLTKRLMGQYKVSLKEILYKRHVYELWPSEPIYFLMLSNDYEEFCKFRKTIRPWAADSTTTYIASWEESGFPLFKWALVFAHGDDTNVTATPMGYLSSTMYAGWCNSMLQMTGTQRGFMHGHLQFEYEKVIITVGGNNNPNKKVVVFPIFGPQTRALLGYPDPDNRYEFEGLLRLLADPSTEFIAMNHNMKAQTGDLVVTCNIVEPNALKMDAPYSDRILRCVPMQDRIVERAGHSDPVVQRFSGWNELRLPVQPGKYEEIVVQVLNEDTGREVKFPETIRATLQFNRSNDDPDMQFELVAPENNFIEPTTTSVCKYRARVLVEPAPGNPDLFMQAPQVDSFVTCKPMTWETFSSPLKR